MTNLMNDPQKMAQQLEAMDATLELAEQLGLGAARQHRDQAAAYLTRNPNSLLRSNLEAMDATLELAEQLGLKAARTYLDQAAAYLAKKQS